MWRAARRYANGQPSTPGAGLTRIVQGHSRRGLVQAQIVRSHGLPDLKVRNPLIIVPTTLSPLITSSRITMYMWITAKISR